jgi:hypothetical protein
MYRLIEASHVDYDKNTGVIQQYGDSDYEREQEANTIHAEMDWEVVEPVNGWFTDDTEVSYTHLIRLEDASGNVGYALAILEEVSNG